jgi:hypothetical protein
MYGSLGLWFMSFEGPLPLPLLLPLGAKPPLVFGLLSCLNYGFSTLFMFRGF